MKTIYKFLACALLTTSVVVLSMDKPKEQKHIMPSLPRKQWAAIAGNIILGKAPIEYVNQLISPDQEFNKLLPETRRNLITALSTSSNTTSLKQASDAINSLIQNSPYLDNVINDSDFCFSLIKYYSKRFNTNDETVCKALNTPCTLNRLAFQDSFMRDICINHQPSTSTLKTYSLSGIDLYFTDSNNQTPAELCISLNNSEGLKMLLREGFDPEYVGLDGLSLYNQAVSLTSMPQTSDVRTIIRVLDLAIEEKGRQSKKGRK